ncbi:MAG: DNA primase, partial [Clostridia bacterium]|nr:DNA primase [Clostridia bacterium]
MSRNPNDEIIEEIRSRIDIADLIGEYVVLQKKGLRFVGLCPFHAEKTPSFTVTPEKGFFYCFGCGQGGDIFSFLMKYEGIDFPQAVEKLARRVGLDPDSLRMQDPGSPQRRKLERLKAINREAAHFYYLYLHQDQAGAAALRYLKARGINRQSQRDFALGYSPGSWDVLLKHLLREGFQRDELIQAGVVSTGEKDQCYDRFRHRLMFPITNTRGEVVGFGGRVLGDGEPKYLNSPETRIFQKKKMLYGLYQALPAIRQQKRALLMEGYLDVIISHQYGLKNAVASLGTAFTPDHARLLRRYTREVILLLDNDLAGRQATDRAIEIFQEQGLDLRVARLEGAKDPDEFLRNFGREAFEEMLDQALPVIVYKFQCLKADIPPQRVGGKAEIVQKLLPELGKVRSQVEVQEYVQMLARELELAENVIMAEYSRYRRKMQKNGMHRDKSPEIRNNTKVNAILYTPPYTRAQHNAIRLLLQNPDLAVLMKNRLAPEVFTDPVCREIFQLAEEMVTEREPEQPVMA